jgi:hypothetical protein
MAAGLSTAFHTSTDALSPSRASLAHTSPLPRIHPVHGERARFRFSLLGGSKESAGRLAAEALDEEHV